MKSTVFLLTLLLSIISTAQEDAGWLRHSAISPDGSQIAFTYKGDLYRVSSNGGDATQLTFHEAHDYMAVWSKDGSELAFASNRYGNFDIFIMSAKGGNAKRLTYHSSDEKPYTFSSDGNNIYFSGLRQDHAQHRQFPTGSQPEAYSVPKDGGRIDQLFTIPAEYLQVNNSGNVIAYQDKKGGENEWRKHHNSSIARDIWLYDKSTGKHRMITNFDGEDRQPVFGRDDQTLYYLSEQSGSFNIYKKALDSNAPSKQVTNFDLHPVRFLSIGGKTLSFSYHGNLYTMVDGEQPKKLQVNITTQQIGNTDRFISINGGVSEMAISPNGKEIAFVARGEVFVTSVDESFTKRITNTPQAEDFVSWGPDGKSVVYSSERNGKWSTYKSEIIRDEEPFFFASTLIKETPLIENEKDNYLVRYSPDGTKYAFIEDRRTLKVKDVKSGKESILLTPEELFHMRDGDKYFRWSPDSKWLLVDWSLSLNNSDVLLMAADGSKKVNLNESGYYDSSPVWANEGKQMLWFSNKDGLKSYATSGSTQSDVYSMFFDEEAWEEFNLSKEEFALMKEIKKLSEKENDDEDDSKSKKKSKKDKDEEKPKIKDLKFDWEEMKDRTKRLTIHSSNLRDAVLSKEGDKLYYLTSFEDDLNLWSTDLRTKETKMIIPLSTKYGNLMWDDKKENLYVLSNGKISKIDLDKNKLESIKISGEMEYDAIAERQAMFDHVWLRTNKVFYHSNFHGIDWDMMKKEYEQKLPYLGNSMEFAELLSEMLGELNVSHAGASGATHKVENEDETASLGIFADYSHDEEGLKISEIINGGPLDKSSLEITPGMIIKKIDGTPVAMDVDVATYLNRKAGQFTLLEIYDPSNKKTRQVTIKPITLGEERGLLYKRWVKRNEMEVEKKSNGQLGYVHIPGMGDGPYRDVYEKMMGKYHDRKAMIIDTRFNGGGDLVADLAAFFTGKPFITYATEQKVVGGEPTSRWTKPTLAMINEAQYSDGHCFAAGYTDLGIGLTVGMPTPGTCSFAGWEGLPDGSRWGVVPVSAKDINGQWMENNQTNPMIQVKNLPGFIDKGEDQQLERAIDELLKVVQDKKLD